MTVRHEQQRGNKILRLVFLSHESKQILLHVSVPVHARKCRRWHQCEMLWAQKEPCEVEGGER